ncbi:DUF4933 domain-containing protein [Maribellus maritimus]|uniref:DUF4933 domain-containing protein n=1 Tax=Maribellus maritimus TaxID=2870838 RepID=UPI001EEC84CE|nr:DUF4933 domain-containing protein [Maribellus maritimus]MCG6189814.1 DUF4933 domain-containing protein [Maribellus maritimus]
MKRIFSSFIILILIVSCSNKNKLNTNEQKLAAEIKTEELQKLEAEKAAQENTTIIPDSLPPGFRFQEDRSVDLQFTPKVIDISNFQNTKKNFKLSDLIHEIKYIPLENIPNKINDKSLGYTPKLADNYILIKSGFSLFLFNRDGSFKDVVCESPNGYVETSSGSDIQTATISSLNNAKGVWGDVWSIGNKLFYRYVDNGAKKNFLMTYDMDSRQNPLSLPADKEKYQVAAKGKIQASLGIEREERFSEYIPLSDDSYAGINRKTKSAMQGQLMTSFRLNGDTLTSFPEYETISNYSHSVMRGNFPQFIYQYKNTATFLNTFNDTVYRVIPPNRLLPAYILNMGEYKIKTQEGFTPGQDISSKLYIKDFFETPKYIYIKLIQGYDSPNNRKNKNIKIYYVVYEKENGRLYQLPVNPKGYCGAFEGVQSYYVPQGIVNDIDGGFLFWPQNVNAKGEIYEVVSGEKLKKHITSDRFNYSSASKYEKDKLKTLAEKVKGDQLILIVYK